MCVQISGVKQKNETFFENRTISTMPHFDYSKFLDAYNECVRFINDFNSYYSDNFGLRNIFYGVYREIKVNIYHTDPFPQKVVKGKEDWYFLGDYYSNDIRVSKGINNFSKGELSSKQK